MLRNKIHDLNTGDIISLEFSPQSGSEMKDWHPALVVSPHSYNKRSSLVIVCPITSKIRGWPWEVRIPSGLPINGVVLVDQIKSLDIKTRNARYECEAPREVTEEVLGKIATLLLEFLEGNE